MLTAKGGISMSDLSLFNSSMSNVLNQWSDFRVSKNLYKAYFDMQKTNGADKKDSSDQSYIQKLINGSTQKLSTVNDKLKSNSNAVSDSVGKLENAFKADKETGDIDIDKAFSAAEDFVKSYNDLAGSIKNAGNNTVSNKSQLISNMTNAYNYKLQKVGITANADGSLSIDKDKFSSASATDLDKVFGRKDSYASFIDGQAKQLAAYAQTDAYQNANAYSQTGNITNISNISGSFLDMLG